MSNTNLKQSRIGGGQGQAPAPPEAESICQVCDGNNPVWFAPNELWNKVIGSRLHFVCPNCFIKYAIAMGIDPVWELREADNA